MTAEERREIAKKRLEAQKKRLSKQREERLKAQEERITKQRKTEDERAAVGHKRGQETTGLDALEQRELSAESRWAGKWGRRKAKWDRRAKWA